MLTYMTYTQNRKKQCHAELLYISLRTNHIYVVNRTLAHKLFPYLLWPIIVLLGQFYHLVFIQWKSLQAVCSPQSSYSAGTISVINYFFRDNYITDKKYCRFLEMSADESAGAAARKRRQIFFASIGSLCLYILGIFGVFVK